MQGLFKELGRINKPCNLSIVTLANMDASGSQCFRPLGIGGRERRSSKWEVWDNISSQFTQRPFISLCLSLHKRLLSFDEANICREQKIEAFGESWELLSQNLFFSYLVHLGIRKGQWANNLHLSCSLAFASASMRG